MRGYAFLAFFVFAAWTSLTLFVIPSYIFRGWNRSLHRRWIAFCFGTYWEICVFWFEKVNGIDIKFTGDRPRGEDDCVIVVTNHPTEMDMPFFWLLPFRAGHTGHVKFVTKAAVRCVPLLGWGINACDYLFLARNWEKDQAHIAESMDSFSSDKDPCWWVLFPEGTDFNAPKGVELKGKPEKKLKDSQAFQRERNLPILSKVLQPKSRGLYAMLKGLRPNPRTIIYDYTFMYDSTPRAPLDIVNGRAPNAVHIHMKRVTLDHVGTTEEEVKEWTNRCFVEKDRQLTHLAEKGCFDGESYSSEWSLVEWAKLIFSTVMWNLLILVAIRTIFTSYIFRSWFVVASIGMQIWVVFFSGPGAIGSKMLSQMAIAITSQAEMKARPKTN